MAAMLDVSRRWAVTVMLALAFAAYTCPPVAGEQAARFTLKTVDGRYEQIDDLLKKGPALFVFWAIWCKDCKNELQALDGILTDDIRARATIVAVTIDTPRSITLVKSYIAAKKMNYLYCTDPNSELLRQFGGKAIPYTVLLDRDRTIALRHIGYSPGDETRILDLLRKHTAAPDTSAVQSGDRKR